MINMYRGWPESCCVVYSDWTVDQVKAADLCNIVVLYASAYGNTAALAQVRPSALA